MSFTINTPVDILINQINTKEISIEDIEKNLKFNHPVKTDLQAVKLDWVLENYDSFYADPYSLQRFLTPWEDKKRNSYLTTLLCGLHHKDSFQLAHIEPLVNDYKNKIKSGECTSKELKAFNYALKELESLLKKGKTYIILDGQHRLKEIYDYLKGNNSNFIVSSGFDHEATINYIDENNNPQSKVFQLGGKFTDLPPIAQVYILKKITIAVTIFSTGSLRILAYVFSASNNGLPLTWHEDRSVLHHNNYIHWLKNRILKSGFRDEFWNYVKLSAPLNQKGDTLFLSHITPWYLLQQEDNHGISTSYSFATNESDLLYADGFTMKEKYIENLDSIFTIIETMLLSYQPKKKIKYGEMFDLFYVVWKLSESKIAGQKYKISRTDEFFTWFKKSENDRIERDRYVVVNGVNVEARHSYKGKLSRMSKENFEYRIVEIEKDITRDLPTLIKEGIITAVGSRSSSLSLEDVALHNNMMTGIGEPITELDLYSKKGRQLEINEKKPVSQGGKRILENVDIQTPSHNKKIYNQVQKQK